jgi:hypothetical protein
MMAISFISYRRLKYRVVRGPREVLVDPLYQIPSALDLTAPRLGMSNALYIEYADYGFLLPSVILKWSIPGRSDLAQPQPRCKHLLNSYCTFN